MFTVCPPFGKATAHHGHPLPQQAVPCFSWAPVFPYLIWTNACRQSQKFRPLTSASSSQGTTQETEKRGWGSWEGRRGKGTNWQLLQPWQSFTYVCGFTPMPYVSFHGISSFRKQVDNWALQGKGWLHSPGCRTCCGHGDRLVWG